MSYKPLSREFLLNRGYCCKNNCLNCPWKENNMNKKFKNFWLTQKDRQPISTYERDVKLGWDACKQEVLKIIQTFKCEDDYTIADKIEDEVDKL